MSSRTTGGLLLVGALALALWPVAAPGQALESPLTLELVIDGYGPGKPFREPRVLEVTPRQRTIYVGDTGNNAIATFNSIGALRGRMADVPGTHAPVGLAALDDERLLGTEADTSMLTLFDQAGVVEDLLDLSQLSLPGTVAGARPSLGRLAADARSRVYIIDQANSRVIVYDLVAGEVVRSTGRPGTSPGEFLRVEDVAVGPDGTLYVVDSQGTPVQRFDREGRYMRSLGRHGNGPDELALPVACDVDRFGQVWVVDHLASQLVVFGPTGDEVLRYGRRGTGRGDFDGPIDVCVDRFGRAYVLEQTGRRVQIFEAPRPYRPFSRAAQPMDNPFGQPEGIPGSRPR